LAAIRTEAIGKRYRVGQDYEAYGMLRDALMAGLKSVVSGRQGHAQQRFLWALKDVSVELQPGDILGIVGPNGSGKSTFLKILSRVTRPTVGRVVISGRVGSLLEVGTGFHPELTGRENVYLNGAILGMRRAEISRQFDEIVDFSGVETYLDTPVKRYSTGMYMRLAFAVAAHLNTEILLVDEVLAVGDAAFQRKCLRAMEGAAHAGRTVVFVSHNLVAIQNLCNRAVWVSGGEVVDDGHPSGVVTNYLHSFSSGVEVDRTWDDASKAPGTNQLRLRRARVGPQGPDGKMATGAVTMRTPIVVELEYWNLTSAAYLNVFIQLVTEDGIVAFESNPPGLSPRGETPLDVGLFRSLCHIPGDLLNAGTFRILVAVVQDGIHTVFQDDSLLTFEVQDAPDMRLGWYGTFPGVVRPRLSWSTELVDPTMPDAAS
jgi:lipopolysaccharide transport system ATP-binding protein